MEERLTIRVAEAPREFFWTAISANEYIIASAENAFTLTAHTDNDIRRIVLIITGLLIIFKYTKETFVYSVKSCNLVPFFVTI